MKRLFLSTIFIFLSWTFLFGNQKLIIQSSTSVKNSGLYEHLLPSFEDQTDIKIYVVAVGTGAAIKNAKNCDGDLLIVHALEQELNFIQEGYGDWRSNLMHNDYVIVGPKTDPAKIRNIGSTTLALRNIKKSESSFMSRGDYSGTHTKEISLWMDADIDPEEYSGTWYLETGAGQISTLNISVAMDAYALTDRASFIALKEKQAHTILLEGLPNLLNQYGIILVSKYHCPDMNIAEAEKFIHWILSAEGQKRISDYKVNNQQLFFTDQN